MGMSKETRDNSKPRDERTRNWTFLVYPESAPANWREILNDLHIPWVESPLHDKDIDTNGEILKAHWHVLLMFDGNKSFSQVCEIAEQLNSPIPEKAGSARGLVRYMAHMDNPDKYQYSVMDIVGHGGVDVLALLKATKAQRYELIREMIAFIKENEIVELKDLIDYASSERFEDWFPLLCDNSTYVINSYITSNRHKIGR